MKKDPENVKERGFIQWLRVVWPKFLISPIGILLFYGLVKYVSPKIFEYGTGFFTFVLFSVFLTLSTAVFMYTCREMIRIIEA